MSDLESHLHAEARRRIDPVVENKRKRDRLIIRTSLLGVAVNLVLAAAKALIGFASNSIAVMLDAVNNLSDILSSVITIAGTRLAGRTPDREHPLGHGRIEYLAAVLVAGLVIYAGVTSLVESIRKIVRPEVPEYTPVSLALLAMAVAAKIVLGVVVMKRGRAAKSDALIASGEDAFYDAVISASVLASALIFVWTGVSLEAWVGVLIALIIIRAGLKVALHTLDDILGRRADENLSRKIREILLEDGTVRGAYDLMLHNYGTDRNYGSVNLELPDTLSLEEAGKLCRRAEARVYGQTGVILTAVGIYPYNTSDDRAAGIRDAVMHKVLSHDWVKQVHGFQVDLEEKNIRFDAVIGFDRNPEEGRAILTEDVQQLYPDFTVSVTPDMDITD